MKIVTVLFTFSETYLLTTQFKIPKSFDIFRQKNFIDKKKKTKTTIIKRFFAILEMF